MAGPTPASPVHSCRKFSAVCRQQIRHQPCAWKGVRTQDPAVSEGLPSAGSRHATCPSVPINAFTDVLSLLQIRMHIKRGVLGSAISDIQ